MQILNVTNVKLLLKDKIQCFLSFFETFLFQTLFKGQHSFISWFFTCYCLKLASKIGNISKFTKELEIFTVDGTQYTFHENWLQYQTFSNLRILKPPFTIFKRGFFYYYSSSTHRLSSTKKHYYKMPEFQIMVIWDIA